MSKKYLFFVSQDYSFPVLRPLQEAILLRGDEVKWFMYGNEIHMDFLEECEEQLFSVEEIIDFNPHAVFVPGNVVPSFIPGVKVQVFHGLPSTKAKKNGQLYHFIIRGMFDLYCTQGISSTNKFQELSKEHGFFNVKETGWCKLDPLFPLTSNESNSTKKTIFFASTFSPRFSKAMLLYPFICSMIKKYDYKWYITLHPKMDPKTVALYKSIEGDNVKFIESIDIISAFKKSHIMLCDTSSIIYEFLTQHKPVITFQTQKEEPSIINITKLEKLEETIVHTLQNLNLNNTEIKKHVNEFHSYSDGQSSQRVLEAVDELCANKNALKKRKPLNIIRNLKLRKELKYWSI